MKRRTPAPPSLQSGIFAGLAIEGIALGALAAVWVLIGGGASVIFRAAYCPSQPITESCTITIRQ
jgi:hypothetical protein